MCDPVSMTLTAFQGMNAIQQGRTAKAQADMQAMQSDYQAGVEHEAALQTAAMIRRAGRYQVGQAAAGYAGAGVKVGEGSALETERQIDQNVEHDAFQALLEGDRRARGLQVQGVMQREQGRMAQAAGYVNAVGTVLQSGYRGLTASGWRTAGPGWSGTQAPAPVEDRSFRLGYEGRPNRGGA